MPVTSKAKQLIAVIVETAAVRFTAIVAFDHAIARYIMEDIVNDSAIHLKRRTIVIITNPARSGKYVR